MLQTNRFLGLGVALAAAAVYSVAGLSVGSGALDSDTLSLVVAWDLLREGVAVDHWQMAVPKFLPIIVDGLAYEMGGLPGVLARSVLTSALVVAAGFWFLSRAYSAAAGAVFAVFLLANRAMWEGTFGGNSTVLFLLCLLVAAVMLLRERGGEVNEDAGVWLVLAALVRQEGVVFLGLLGVVLAWQARKKGAAAMAARATLTLLAVVAVVASHSLMSMALTNDHLSSSEIARRNANILQTIAAPTSAGGFLTTSSDLLAGQLRPLILYVVIVPLGWYAASRKLPLAGAALGALALVPVAYCGVLHSIGLPLFERFLFPTVVAVHLCAAIGYLHLWRAAEERLAGLPPQVAKALIALVALAALSVSLRDTWHSRQGYLLAESRARRSYSEGLWEMSASPSTEGPVLASGLHYPYAILQGPWAVSDVEQDQFVLEADPDTEQLSRFQIILYDRDARAMQDLLGAYLVSEAAERLRIGDARYKVAWMSADGRFEFLRKVSP